MHTAKDHPNVLQLLHHEVVDDVLWIITEYCDGNNLADFVGSIHPDLHQKLEMMDQLASASLK